MHRTLGSMATLERQKGPEDAFWRCFVALWLSDEPATVQTSAMTILYFCLATLIGAVFCGMANRAVLTAWFDGDIFEHARMALKTRFAATSLPDNPTHIETTPDAAINVPKPVLIPLHGWDRLASYMPKLLVQLLLCRLCLSYHTAFWVYVLGWVPAMYLASYDCHTLAAIWLAPIVALAVVGVGQSDPAIRRTELKNGRDHV